MTNYDGSFPARSNEEDIATAVARDARLFKTRVASTHSTVTTILTFALTVLR